MALAISNKKNQILANNKKLIEEIFTNNSLIYALGINEYTDNLIDFLNEKGIKLKGILDDYNSISLYRNIPVYKSKDISKNNTIIISCVIDGKLLTAIKRLRQNGFTDIITYLHLFLYDESLGLSRYLYNTVQDILENMCHYNWLYEALEDTESKVTLEKLIDFRFNFNHDAMGYFKYNLDNQYFEDFLPITKDETFVDCGGYDGNTTLTFIKKCPTYKKIYYIEPYKPFFQKSMERLKNYNNISFINKATLNEVKEVSFNVDGSASQVSDSGDCKVQTIRLDDILLDKITFIKMDVEGSEYESLLAAENVIKKNKPKLAICVYHKQEDFWRIPKLIMKYNPSYKVYLRHYTEGILETVMYFI